MKKNPSHLLLITIKKLKCIGDKEFATKLFNYGIEPETILPEHEVCSIGFSEELQKWFGWTHRSIWGFKIGSEVKKSDIAYLPSNKQDFIEHKLNFFKNEYTYDIKFIGESTNEYDDEVILIEKTYNDLVPNEKMRNTKDIFESIIPSEWGNGEWEAKTLEDAKQMAIDFVKGCS